MYLYIVHNEQSCIRVLVEEIEENILRIIYTIIIYTQSIMMYTGIRELEQDCFGVHVYIGIVAES